MFLFHPDAFLIELCFLLKPKIVIKVINFFFMENDFSNSIPKLSYYYQGSNNSLPLILLKKKNNIAVITVYRIDQTKVNYIYYVLFHSSLSIVLIQ